MRHRIAARVPSIDHETVLEMFRARPEILSPLLGPGVLPDVPPEVLGADLTQLTPTEYRADLVLRWGEVAVILEAQRTIDSEKRRSWPVYVTTLAARARVDVLLVVVAWRRGVAAWARRPIALGHPGFVLSPIVLGPEEIPRVTDPAEAGRSPELAVLSALAHGRSVEAEAIGRAGLEATRSLDEDRRTLYSDLILRSLDVATRQLLESEMFENYQYQSRFFKRLIRDGLKEGRKAGRAEGRVEGRVEALLELLAARGFEVDETTRQRILDTTDCALLKTWQIRALDAPDLASVFADRH